MATDESNLRKRIVDTALELAEQRSWEAVRLHDVAARLNVTLEDVRQHFREKEDVAEAWFDRADRAMLEASDPPEFLQLAPRQRLHRLIMTWLGALASHRRATRQIIFAKLEPGHVHVQVPGIMRVSRTVQWMREAAHRDATYLRRALEETALTSIYLTTFFHWMRDDSRDSAATARLLEGLLGVAERLDRAVYRTRGATPRRAQEPSVAAAGDAARGGAGAK
jgi:ubiquinone biosynthesis protein COQ9